LDISEALTLDAIPHTIDSRSKYRTASPSGNSILPVYVIGDDMSDALSKALALEECPLLFVSATGRVLVLRSGITGAVALEAVDTPTDLQTAVLALIGKSVWDRAKISASEFYERPASSRKKPKPEVTAEIPDEITTSDPSLEEVDTSEPTE
jgi:hypothetical protein